MQFKIDKMKLDLAGVRRNWFFLFNKLKLKEEKVEKLSIENIALKVINGNLERVVDEFRREITELRNEMNWFGFTFENGVWRLD